MRIALISDIHANIHALDAVLADLDARGDVDATYHVGDLVGYSAHPNAVIDRLRERHVAGVAGNYDSTVATGYKHCGCRSESPRQEALAHESFAYTLRATSDDSKRYLRSLPFSLDLRPLGGHLAGPRLVLVHGTPTLNTVYWDQDRSDDFCRKMAQLVGLRAGDAIAVGHTHKPWHRQVDGMHFINTGSVGRPKDGDWRAGYVLLELGEDAAVGANIGAGAAEAAAPVRFVRVPYDVDAAVRDVETAGLPAEFGPFLRTGGRPA
jgi:predicted phosphodiesterase